MEGDPPEIEEDKDFNEVNDCEGSLFMLVNNVSVVVFQTIFTRQSCCFVNFCRVFFVQ